MVFPASSEEVYERFIKFNENLKFMSLSNNHRVKTGQHYAPDDRENILNAWYHSKKPQRTETAVKIRKKHSHMWNIKRKNKLNNKLQKKPQARRYREETGGCQRWGLGVMKKMDELFLF